MTGGRLGKLNTTRTFNSTLTSHSPLNLLTVSVLPFHFGLLQIIINSLSRQVFLYAVSHKTCDKCDYEANQRSLLRRRYDNVHLGRKYQCTECDREFFDFEFFIFVTFVDTKQSISQIWVNIRNQYMKEYHMNVNYVITKSATVKISVIT